MHGLDASRYKKIYQFKGVFPLSIKIMSAVLLQDDILRTYENGFGPNFSPFFLVNLMLNSFKVEGQ